MTRDLAPDELHDIPPSCADCDETGEGVVCCHEHRCPTCLCLMHSEICSSCGERFCGQHVQACAGTCGLVFCAVCLDGAVRCSECQELSREQAA